MNYKEFCILTAGTCTDAVQVVKDGKEYIAVYNSLSYWAKIFAPVGGEYVLVEELSAPFDEEEGQLYNFNLSDFMSNGYRVVDPPEWLQQQ